ncbi:MAG: ribonuclease D [Aestuariibacter sp.]
MDFEYIDSDAALANFCQQASTAEFISVDTEFVRTRTYFPQCGLIQINDGRSVVLVDPLMIEQWRPLAVLLTDPNVIKVLHSCSEDLEVFWRVLGIMPTPLFDSQFAAALLNMGPSIGYAKMVEDMLNIAVDKGESRTDWLKRPLREEQLHYAAKDVIYLHQIYPQLAEPLKQANKYQWVLQDSEVLSDKKQQALPPEYRYLTVKNGWQLQRQQLAVLQKLAAWRYEKAVVEDRALNFVLKETCLIEISRRLPKHPSELHALHCITGKEVRLHGEELIAMVDEVLNMDESHYPERIRRLVDIRAYKKVSQMIRNECQRIAEENDLPLELLASKKQVNQFLKWLWFDVEECKIQQSKPDLMRGWRYELLKSVLDDVH